MNQKVITMTAYKRPDYTKQVLDNLQKCINFEKYTLLVNIEPGYSDVIKLFDNIPNCDVIVNKQVLGCAINTFNTLRRGFEQSDYVIHLEDDTIPGIDSLLYLEWVNNTYKNDSNIFTASAYNRVYNINEIGPKDYFSAKCCPWFTGWMWATWKDRFEEMDKNWDFIDRFGWDNNINKNIRGNRLEITPKLPRSRNIGEKQGTYTTPKLWKNQQYSPVWVNDFREDILKLLGKYKKLSANRINDSIYPYYEMLAVPGDCPIDNKISIIVGIVIFAGIGYLIHRKIFIYK